jgi:26S proteasome regulatory subunit N5
MEALQIETYGTMDKREKVEIILEQMKLCLATQIISQNDQYEVFQ